MANQRIVSLPLDEWFICDTRFNSLEKSNNLSMEKNKTRRIQWILSFVAGFLSPYPVLITKPSYLHAAERLWPTRARPIGFITYASMII